MIRAKLVVLKLKWILQEEKMKTLIYYLFSKVKGFRKCSKTKVILMIRGETQIAIFANSWKFHNKILNFENIIIAQKIDIQ